MRFYRFVVISESLIYKKWLYMLKISKKGHYLINTKLLSSHLTILFFSIELKVIKQSYVLVYCLK
jgi:hypothetical protein